MNTRMANEVWRSAVITSLFLLVNSSVSAADLPWQKDSQVSQPDAWKVVILVGKSAAKFPNDSNGLNIKFVDMTRKVPAANIKVDPKQSTISFEFPAKLTRAAGQYEVELTQSTAEEEYILFRTAVDFDQNGHKPQLVKNGSFKVNAPGSSQPWMITIELEPARLGATEWEKWAGVVHANRNLKNLKLVAKPVNGNDKEVVLDKLGLSKERAALDHPVLQAEFSMPDRRNGEFKFELTDTTVGMTKTMVSENSVVFSVDGRDGSPLSTPNTKGGASPFDFAVTGNSERKGRFGVTEFILNEVRSSPIPGYVYYDHDPQSTTKQLRDDFSELSLKAISIWEQLVKTGKHTNPDAVLEARRQLALEVHERMDKLYRSRSGIQDDWDALFEDTYSYVRYIAKGSTVSLKSSKRAIRKPDIPPDLSDLRDTAAIFTEIAEAMDELNQEYRRELRRRVEARAGYGGGSVGTSVPTTGSYPSDCRRRRKPCCWNLLLGL